MTNALTFNCRAHRFNLRAISSLFAGGHNPAISSSSGSKTTEQYLGPIFITGTVLQGGMDIGCPCEQVGRFVNKL